MLTEEKAQPKTNTIKSTTPAPKQEVSPASQENSFTYNNLFFSVTDSKAAITHVNDFFAQVSKYEQHEIVGLHSKKLWHKDMPRAISNIFYRYQESKKTAAAYVKNVTKDGSYFWAMEVSFPCKGGHLSIRLKPGSTLFGTVQKMYTKILRLEEDLDWEENQQEAAQASHNYLLELVNKEGFADYEEFMWNALQLEMRNREEKLATSSVSADNNKAVPPSLLKLESILAELVLSLENLEDIHGALVDHSNYILKLARSILLLSLNAQIGSSKLNQSDHSLSVVAEKMGEQSVSGEEKLIKIKESIQSLSTLIGKLNLKIISSKLQVEMTTSYLSETYQDQEGGSTSSVAEKETKGMLNDAFMPTVDQVMNGIGKIPANLRELLHGVKDIERFLQVLRFIHITGKVEVARMNEEANSFSTTFQDLVREIQTAEKHLKKLTTVVEDNKGTATMYVDYRERLYNIIRNIERIDW
ncbi:MAG: PAS domain S-box protein [Balneolaceae bacterium]|nr:PAS domain S-box protein [Balneolaceae bacterium]